MAAGVVGLALQANPCLSWRDVQNLIARNSDSANLVDQLWQANGAGLRFSHRFGFGVMRADWLVAAARQSVPLAGRVGVRVGMNAVDLKQSRLSLTANTDGCDPSGKLCLQKLEHVRVAVTMSGGPRSGLTLSLVSPQGTTSKLLTPRPYDSGSDLHWTFTSVFCWGERAAGTWTLVMENGNGPTMTLDEWGLELYGTAAPAAYQSDAVPVVQLPGSTCTLCPSNSFPNGVGGCGACDSSCDGRCVGPGTAGCAANFESLAWYTQDEASKSWLNSKQSRHLVVLATRFFSRSHPFFPPLTVFCSGPYRCCGRGPAGPAPVLLRQPPARHAVWPPTHHHRCPLRCCPAEW